MILVVSYTDVTLFQRYEARQAVAKTHYEEQKKQYQQSLAGDAAAPAVAPAGQDVLDLAQGGPRMVAVGAAARA